MRDCFILLKQSSIIFKKIYKFFKKTIILKTINNKLKTIKNKKV